MSTLRVNKLENTNTSNGGISIDTSGHVSIDGQQLPSSGPLSNRNLIINGAMTVAQRGTGNFAITADSYPVDRFLFSNAGTTSGNANGTQSTTTPPGFKNSLEVDVTSTDTSLDASAQYKIEHRIEGHNVAHLNWGTANAKAVTLSFYIKSNKTGETAVALLNDGNNRAYVATFDINAANTWEQKTLTISGPTDGTWLDTNGIGIRLRWGTYGSNFQTSSTNQWVSSQVMTSTSAINFFDDDTNNLFLTGVQLEVGETATPFENRSYGDELYKCQRYFVKSEWQFCTQITGVSNRFIVPGPGVVQRTNADPSYFHPITGTANQCREHSSGTTRTINDASAMAPGGGATASQYFGTTVGATLDVQVTVNYDAEL